MSDLQDLTDEELDFIAGGITERPGGGGCTDDPRQDGKQQQTLIESAQ